MDCRNLFSIQIYCDFTGYSTIAIGAAQIMGVTLMENFDMPYFARGIQDFRRRMAWGRLALYFLGEHSRYLPSAGAFHQALESKSGKFIKVI